MMKFLEKPNAKKFNQVAQKTLSYSKSPIIRLVKELWCDLNSKYEYAKRPNITFFHVYNLQISWSVITLALMKITNGPLRLGLYNNFYIP